MLNRGVTQEPGGVAEDAAVLVYQLVFKDLAVPGQGSDGQVVALVPDVAQVVQLTQVDQSRRNRQPESHERYEGVSPGQEPGVLSVLAQELYGVVYRLGDLVVERCRVHYSSPPSCLTSAPRASSEASACLSPDC